MRPILREEAFVKADVSATRLEIRGSRPYMKPMGYNLRPQPLQPVGHQSPCLPPFEVPS